MTPASTTPTAVSTPPASRQLLPLCVGLAIILALFLVWTFKIGIPHGLIGRTDFRSMYTAGTLERTHPTQLYSLDAQQDVQTHRISQGEFTLPFFHPGYEAFLFVPFSLLPYPAAYLGFVLCNLLFLALCVLAGLRVFSVTIPFLQPRPGLIVFFFLPLYLAILQGQDSILFLLLLVLVWNQIDDKKDLRAGLLLAAALFKFQIVLPLACLLAIRRGPRLLKGFLLGAAGVVALSFAASPQSPASFVALLRRSALAGSKLHGAGYQGYIFPLQMANLRGLFFALFGAHLSSRGILVLTLAVSAVVFLIVAACMRRIGDEFLAFAAALLACMLTSYHLLPHDATPLLLPILAIAAKMRLWKWPLVFALYLAPVVFFFFTGGPNSFFLVSIPVTLALAAILFARQPQPA